MVENRICVVSILVQNMESGSSVSTLLSEFGRYAVGRMGIPYREKNINVICFVMDAPMEEINSLSGKLGMLPGVKAKVIVSK